MLEESINLLYDVIFNPNITNNAFDNEAFKQIKDNLKSEIETVKEQPRIYAGSRLLEIMDDGPYAYHSYCYMDDLKDLTPTNLYSFYKEFLLNNKVEIFVVGDIDIKKITKLIANRFFFNNQNNVNKSLFYKHHSFKEKVYETTEKGNYNQAKVAASVKLKDLTEFETKYVSVIYNLLLGGTTESLLVKNIRENSSLAYYAYSLLNKADNLIVINCGIDEKNYQQVYNLINKSLNDVLEGNFSLEDINKCIMEYISSLKIAYETPAGVLDLMLAEILYNVDDIKTKMAKIKTVTKEDVMNFSKKTTLDTVFMLKGE